MKLGNLGEFLHFIIWANFGIWANLGISAICVNLGKFRQIGVIMFLRKNGGIFWKPDLVFMK